MAAHNTSPRYNRTASGNESAYRREASPVRMVAATRPL
jgi:hypothetical protein